MARWQANRSAKNSASSAACSKRSITISISISSNGCATTTIYFSPDHDNGHARLDAATVERAYQEMIETLKDVLHNANFIEIPHDEINRAHREHALVQVDLEAPRDDYREVRFFRRGHHRETIEIPEWLGWRKRAAEIDVYDDVVLAGDDEERRPGTDEDKTLAQGQGAARRGAAEIFPRHRADRPQCAVSGRARGDGAARPARGSACRR